jgi:hypothetical protein
MNNKYGRPSLHSSIYELFPLVNNALIKYIISVFITAFPYRRHANRRASGVTRGNWTELEFELSWDIIREKWK